MNRPNIDKFQRFMKIAIQKYERYLPTAFDESMTILEKMNKLIHYLNDMGLLLNDVVEQWNDVVEWIMNDGLTQSVVEKINDMVEDGTMETIINDELFSKLSNTINSNGINVMFAPSFLESAFGDGMKTDSEIIQRIIDYVDSVGGGKVVIPGKHVYLTRSTLDVPDDVDVELQKGAVIKPGIDIDVVRIRKRSGLSGGGTIDTSNVVNFNSSAIIVDGVDKIGTVDVSSLVENIMLKGSQTGNGIHLIAREGNDHITYTKFNNISIMDYQNAIRLETNTEEGYINGNIFDNITVTRCHNGINMTGRTNQNQFGSLVYQASGSISPERVIYCEGSRNYFDNVTVFDWYRYAVNDHSIHFSNSSEYNYLNVSDPASFILDDGSYNHINTLFLEQPMVKERITAPFTARNPSFIGNQDDILSFADKRFTVIQNQGEPKNEQLKNLFRPDHNKTVTWYDTQLTPVQLEIDFNETGGMNQFRFLGINFKGHNYATNVKIEAYVDGGWEVLKETSNNTKSQVIGYFGYISRLYNGVQRIRFTFGGFHIDSNTIIVERIFGASASEVHAPITYLTPDGGGVYGDVVFEEGKSVVLSNPVGEQYKISIDENGQVITTLYSE